MSADIRVKMSADTSAAAKGIKDIDGKIERLGKTAEETSSKIKNFLTVGGLVTTAVAGFKALSGAAKELIGYYAVQEQAEKRLNNAIKATGNIAGVSATGLKSLASSLQSVTTYGDEAILDIETLYVATGKIGNEMMPRATEAALDMAAALGGNTTEAAKKLARVLADPTQGLDALKESNIMLSKAQMEEIGNMAKQGDMLGAQTKILEAVEGAYAGTARAIAETDTGKLTQISNVYGDIKEGLGSALLDSISPALDVLYKQLEKISGWVTKYATKVDILDAARDGLSLEGYSDADLENALATADKAAKGGVRGHGQKMNAIAADNIRAEQARRNAVFVDESNAALEANVLNSGTNSGKNFKRPTGNATAEPEEAAAKSFFDTYKSTSKAYLNSFYDEEIEKGKKEREGLKETSLEYQILTESIDELVKKKEALNAVETPEDVVGNFLGQYGGMSDKYNVASVEKSLEEADVALAKALTDGDTEAIGFINEIIIGLQKQKNEMLGIKTAEELATEEAARRKEEEDETNRILKEQKIAQDEARRNAVGQTNTYLGGSAQFINAAFALDKQLRENEIKEVEDQLAEIEEAYAKHFDAITGMYQKQADALNLYYATGQMSAEEYVAATEELQEEEATAREEAEAKKEELAKKADKLKEKQFNADKANSIIQATISGAQAIANIWGQHGANPVMAGILTGLSTAATAMQIATISAQQYTPMATGAIVNTPTKALIGEAGPELVLPINDVNMKRAGFNPSSDKPFTLVVNVGTAYNADTLYEDIYEGISKLQRKGLLPPGGFDRA